MNIEDHIVGIGGIFFKAQDPEALTQWYRKYLGFKTQVAYEEDDTAITFRWNSVKGEKQNTVWAPFPQDTEYFKPSSKEFMINYIVKDLEGLLKKLNQAGISVLGKIHSYPYGKFAYVLDPEENKIEFWEPDKNFFKDKY